MKATQSTRTKVIYFINDAVPTEFDRTNAENIAGNVVFRNAKFAEDDGAAETCDAVAGEFIPALYAKLFAPAKYSGGYKPTYRKDAKVKIADKAEAKTTAATSGAEDAWTSTPNQ